MYELIHWASRLHDMFAFFFPNSWHCLMPSVHAHVASLQSYSRDLFIFLFVILTLVAYGSSLQTVKQPVLLVRQQTEEWKGWMQVGSGNRYAVVCATNSMPQEPLPATRTAFVFTQAFHTIE